MTKIIFLYSSLVNCTAFRIMLLALLYNLRLLLDWLLVLLVLNCIKGQKLAYGQITWLLGLLQGLFHWFFVDFHWQVIQLNWYSRPSTRVWTRWDFWPLRVNQWFQLIPFLSDSLQAESGDAINFVASCLTPNKKVFLGVFCSSVNCTSEWRRAHSLDWYQLGKSRFFCNKCANH